MFISHETPAQTDVRLRGVIAQADWHVLDGRFAFREYPAAGPFPAECAAQALATLFTVAGLVTHGGSGTGGDTRAGS